MDKIEFESYMRPNGHDEFIEWYEDLPKKGRLKVITVINKVESNGMMTAQRLKWVKKLDTNLYELRSKVGSNIQRACYFHVDHGKYIITHGFTKKTNKTPKKEIKHAIVLR
ncbi:type II toxin-antitoxin system RelE/ParE family toxin, partial [Pediococcus argentinicus]